MDGTIQTSMNGINEAFINYFASILSNPAPHQPNLNPLFSAKIPCISDTQAANLISIITPYEIKKAVFRLNPTSSGGPDGYNAFFLHQCWNTIQNDVISAEQHIFMHNSFPASLSATAIALIPKTENPFSVADFRPISCCNVLYKVITKILAARFQQVLPSIIAPIQTAFIPSRAISDNVLLT